MHRKKIQAGHLVLVDHTIICHVISCSIHLAAQMTIMRFTPIIALVAYYWLPTADSCTSILITKGASALNATMCAHSADCSDCDSRIALVPNRKYNTTDAHPVRGIHHRYPREWSDRALVYFPPESAPLDSPLGYIPQVNETYATWESVYGLMNEHGLTIGESSTYARINSPGVDLENPSTQKKGPALFSIAMLIQVALERCKTARCAVKTMGGAAEQYGFYGETFNAGESLSIGDTVGEGWIFHVLPDPTGKSAVWCARRVPDGHVAALANQFTITTVVSEDTDNYLHSANMYSIAQEQGLWNGQSEFKFNRAYGTPGNLPMYISLRLWFIYNSVAPSLNLSPKVNPFDFPFSVPVDKPVTLEAVMDIYRSRFEGTEFDMTKGILAGPFGNPQRVDAGTGVTEVGGQITRPIAVQRTAYTMIGVADPDNARVYYATDTPSTSVFVPFLASTLRKADASNVQATGDLYSRRFQTGKKTEFDRYSAWWAFDFVANWMNINYANMSAEFVYPSVKEWQPKLIEAGNSGDESVIVAVTDELIQYWWDLADKLIVTYNDGYYTEPSGKASYTGYPAEYLRAIGFNDGFVYPMGVCPATSFGQCSMTPSGNENVLIFSASDVKRTVHELDHLKNVILPKKFNKTIIVNVSEPSFPIVFGDHDSMSTIRASAPAAESRSRTAGDVISSISILLIGALGGYYVASMKRRSTDVNNQDVYARIGA